MKKMSLLWAGVLLAGAAVCYAQAAPESVCEVNVTKVKQGTGKQFEDARKQHNQFHAGEKDKVPIFVWTMLTGPSTGDYLTVSCGMQWKDLDHPEDFDKRHGEDLAKTLQASGGSTTTSYYIYRGDLSTGQEGGSVAKMMTITHYFVKPGGIEAFLDGLKRVKAGVEKTKYAGKPFRWYQLVNGGEGPHYVVVTDRAAWSDMQPPTQTLTEMMKQANGADDKTVQTIRESIDHTMSEMAEYRADLSYLPQK